MEKTMPENDNLYNWDDPFATVQGTRHNPTNRKEAEVEMLNVIHPMNHWDGCPTDGIYSNIKNKTITPPMAYLIVPREFHIDESNLITPECNSYPKAQISALSLDDYQSVCVQRNINNMSGYLIGLCAAGKTEEADKILSGFSAKYKDKLQYCGDNHPVKLENETYEQINADVRKNFKHIFPDFLEQTEKQWHKNRAEIMMFPDYHVEMSNTAYYTVANHRSIYYMPSPENDRITAKNRQDNDSIVADMRTQKQHTKQIMKTDAQNAKTSAYINIQKLQHPVAATTRQTAEYQQPNLIQMAYMQQKING